MSFTREQITEVFRAFDADGSGQVSGQELVNLLTQLFEGDKAKATDAAGFIMAAFDSDHSGQLSLEEFVNGTQKFLNQ